MECRPVIADNDQEITLEIRAALSSEDGHANRIATTVVVPSGETVVPQGLPAPVGEPESGCGGCSGKAASDSGCCPSAASSGAI